MRRWRNVDEHKVAEAFPAGEYLADELKARDWSVAEFARRAVMPEQEVQAILDGGRVGVIASQHIGRAFGVDETLFMRLHLYYRRWQRAG